MEKEFIEFMKNEGLSENTYNSYASDVKIIKQYYEDSYGEELKELIHADVSMYSSFLKKNSLAPTTINRKILALKEYNLFLVNQGIQEGIVIKDKDYIKVQKSMINKKIPTEQEINKLKHFACRDGKNAKRDFCFISIFICGGLRESEIVSIRLVDVKLDEKFLNVIGKGNKFRQVVINSYMYDALADYLEERKYIKTDNPYLFVGQKNVNTKEPLNRNFCNRLLNKFTHLCNRNTNRLLENYQNLNICQMKVIENGIIVPTNTTLQRKGTNLMKNLVVLLMYLNISKKGKIIYGRKIFKIS